MNKYILAPREPYAVRIKMGTHKVVSVGFGILFSIEHEQDEDGNETDTLVYFNFGRGVYVLDFSEDGKYFGIALVPRIRKVQDDEDLQNSGIQLCYFNDERGRMLFRKLKEATDNSCTFIWNAREAEEQMIRMRLMTMTEFDTRYRANLLFEGALFMILQENLLSLIFVVSSSFFRLQEHTFQ